MIKKSQNGFTLVELAIVLMIIGLLIGGILRGQELMENARVTSTIQQVKAYDGASNTFRDTYGALPGDIPNPALRIPGCTGIPCNTSGNGDGIISNDPAGTPIIVTTKGFTGGWSLTTENTTFWLHLAAAHLITGIDASGDHTRGVWGDLFPGAKIAGGFLIVYVNIPIIGSEPAVNGHFLLLKNTPLNANVNEGAGTSTLPPLRAAQIDRKMDDGLPQTGDVIGIGTTNCQGTTYNETAEQKDCNLLIRL